MRICLMCRKRNIDYYGICPECREFSDSKRSETVDLSGMTAVVTGGRIKIGYAVCLRLLRQGARVIAVTRYPKSAMEQYMKEPDFCDFSDRLSVIGFDLMRIDRISELVNCIADISGGVVDILVNNAAQTVKKSSDYYAAAIAHESELSLGMKEIFPVIAPEKHDGFGLIPQNQLIDYGERPDENSWVRKPEEITPQEMLEVRLINVSAPFLLTNSEVLY
ncbi:SDR family NAD(P)-dependent oxidoreductase [Ruminococcus flavefaciens]|uniref:SDR family NAD(P)-dependent oxidoreductase n=1 Tax=Ruminococcus flavefaciens TaxID=1265 RepID=UPI0026EECA41|nr:SDR family NAD(P)-dependent oxidoreductase [Ruminococcus flavefaciens]MDD7515900.1 SDR family NAD(P)-dependent oxidoreductase [Ruminococcus flavefaciens]MDY5691781.1 SDR family NAD(P)-dependent oxidoreductase [Ruminococcus flavefaciens]